jgi:hypothetical protein
MIPRGTKWKFPTFRTIFPEFQRRNSTISPSKTPRKDEKGTNFMGWLSKSLREEILSETPQEALEKWEKDILFVMSNPQHGMEVRNPWIMYLSLANSSHIGLKPSPDVFRSILTFVNSRKSVAMYGWTTVIQRTRTLLVDMSRLHIPLQQADYQLLFSGYTRAGRASEFFRILGDVQAICNVWRQQDLSIPLNFILSTTRNPIMAMEAYSLLAKTSTSLESQLLMCNSLFVHGQTAKGKTMFMEMLPTLSLLDSFQRTMLAPHLKQLLLNVLGLAIRSRQLTLISQVTELGKDVPLDIFDPSAFSVLIHLQTFTAMQGSTHVSEVVAKTVDNVVIQFGPAGLPMSHQQALVEYIAKYQPRLVSKMLTSMNSKDWKLHYVNVSSLLRAPHNISLAESWITRELPKMSPELLRHASFPDFCHLVISRRISLVVQDVWNGDWDRAKIGMDQLDEFVAYVHHELSNWTLQLLEWGKSVIDPSVRVAMLNPTSPDCSQDISWKDSLETCTYIVEY